MPSVPLLSLREVSKSFRDRPLFERLTLHLSPTDRLGIVGPNGAGKSTLLGIVGGRVEPDEGERLVPGPLRVGWVAQVPRFSPGATVLSAVMAADAADTMTGEDGPPGSRSAVGGSGEEATLERRLLSERVLGRLGFRAFEQPVAELSGGWGRRLSLAQALVGDPDLLLLDEPTNHLDLETILWLEGFLRGVRKAFVLVSHDRAFLQRVATRVLEVAPRYPGGTFAVDGPYTTLLERRAAWLEAEARRESALASRLRQELAWLSRGARARSTKARGRVEAVDRLQKEWQEVRGRRQGRSLSIDFGATDRRTRRLLVTTNLGIRVGERWLVRALDLVLRPGLRLGLVGPNGAGKTTLLRTLLGDREPDEGTVRPAPTLKVVYFDQQRETLEPDLSLRRALAPEGDSVLVGERSIHVAGWARRFGFRSDQLETPVGHLSGGEQARILISRLVRRPADVLLLDEPTNDLDISTLEVLEEALREFPGAVVLVTHDRYLLSQVTHAVLALEEEGAVTPYADAEQWLSGRATAQGARDGADREGRSRDRRPRRPPKPLTYGEELELAGMEERIGQAEVELARVEALLADPTVQANAEAVAERYRAVASAQETVDALYARWTELEEKREQGG